ncbi:MAG: integrase arm-type DNA-binding domain-containing protein [Rhodocyclaceae bacterium]
MLTDTTIRNTKPGQKAIKLTDGGGLYLEVTPAGGRHWRYRFRINGKESIHTIGEYPRIGLAEARRKRDDARDLVKEGHSPVLAKQQQKLSQQYENAQTFKAVAEEWFIEAPAKSKNGCWSAGYKASVRTLLDRDILPHLGTIPVRQITTPMAHQVVKRVEARQAATRAILARQIIGGVLKLAILTHRADYNVAEPLKGEIARRVVEHHKHLERGDIGDFLRKLADYTGHRTTSIALELLLQTAVRPGELCGAAWTEFDLDAAEWRIPATRMKMRKLHIVPLSRQSVALVRELQEITGHGQYLLPVQGTKAGTMPVATLRNAIAKMGYSDKLSPHGVRGTFSTTMNEAGYPADHIEVQLAHSDKNVVRRAYNHARYLPERRKLLQDWADMLDGFKAGAKVIPIGKAA